MPPWSPIKGRLAAPERICKINQYPSIKPAGILTVVGNIEIGTRVFILEWGNNTKYAPNTPATAPLAPSIGIDEADINKYCRIFPTIPDKKYRIKNGTNPRCPSILSPNTQRNHMLDRICKNPPCKNMAVTKGKSVVRSLKLICEGISEYCRINESGLGAISC